MAAPPEPALDFSIVICTYGRPAMCRQTVTDLLPQIDATGELIIVDQATEKSRDAYCDPSVPAERVRFFHLPTPGMVPARNFGISQSRGRVVIFLDDDISPSPGLIQGHVAAYSSPSVGGVAGRIISQLEPPSEWLDQRVHDPVAGWLFTNFDHREAVELPTARGCNMSFRRDLLVRLGGFDPNYRWFRDDSDISFRVRQAGFKVMFAPAAELIHLDATTGGTRQQAAQAPGPIVAEWRSYQRYFRHYQDNLYFIRRNLAGAARSHALRDSYRVYVGLSRWPWRLLAKNICFAWAWVRAVRRAAHWQPQPLLSPPSPPKK